MYLLTMSQQFNAFFTSERCPISGKKNTLEKWQKAWLKANQITLLTVVLKAYPVKVPINRLLEKWYLVGIV